MESEIAKFVVWQARHPGEIPLEPEVLGNRQDRRTAAIIGLTERIMLAEISGGHSVGHLDYCFSNAESFFAAAEEYARKQEKRPLQSAPLSDEEKRLLAEEQEEK